jgi:hypothetical protein
MMFTILYDTRTSRVRAVAMTWRFKIPSHSAIEEAVLYPMVKFTPDNMEPLLPTASIRCDFARQENSGSVSSRGLDHEMQPRIKDEPPKSEHGSVTALRVNGIIFQESHHVIRRGCMELWMRMPRVGIVWRDNLL